LNIKDSLTKVILAAAKQACDDGAFSVDNLPEVLLSVPPEKKFGDFASNFAMQLAGAAKKNPRQIAAALIERLQAPFLAKTEIAGPGFMNFYLKSGWIYDLLASIIVAGDQYGSLTVGQGQKVQVEFVSANPTGPLHVGHGRGAAVGSALVNLLKAAGYEVQAEYYINDAGNQIDNLAASVNARYLELLNQPNEFPEAGYHGQDIIETAQRIITAEGDRYLLVSQAERLAIFKKVALAEKLAALKADLAAFHVTFDVWFSEQTLHQNNEIEKVCTMLTANGNMYEQEGARWLKSTLYGDDKDRVVIRDNGIPTYLAADIAYHHNKFLRGFDKVINIWGADHHGYICRVKAAVQALGYNPDNLEVILLQMVNLFRDGELVKMSKRTGQSVTLTELIEEVGTDAARFFFILRSTDSQLDFDLNLAKSRSNENPVYYIQYAHARIKSIFRQVAEAGITVRPTVSAQQLSCLVEQPEIDLIKKLGEYPDEVAWAAQERAPHRIARYVHELASLFHSFYNQCRIIGVDKEVEQARLALVTAVLAVLRQALHILGITAPDRM
jgi:arginyl-tRNA synthetase